MNQIIKKNNKEVYLIGAGGHSRSLVNLLELNNYLIKGIYDDNFTRGEEINGYPLLGQMADIKEDLPLILSTSIPQLRQIWYQRYCQRLLKVNIIHPQATVESRVTVLDSNQLLAGVYVNSNAVIGKNNVFNTRCVIEHEVIIGDHNHIAVGSLICGRVKIGSQCFIGAGATVISNIEICDQVTVGANSVVIRDIVEPGVYVGNPVRKVK